MPLTEDEQIEARLNRIGTYQAGTLMTETGEVWYPADLLLPAAREIARLRAENERLKELEDTASSCLVEANTIENQLRVEVADLKRQLAEAQHWLKSRETELKVTQDRLTKAYEDLALAREFYRGVESRGTKT